MDNTALNSLKTEKLYTVKQVAEALDKTPRWIKELCKSGKLESFTIEGNGGEQYRISESALVKYAEKNNIELDTQPRIFHIPEKQELLSIGTTSPAAPVSSFSLLQSKNYGEIIPERAKEIGLARQDLLNAWVGFRNEAEKKTKADTDFLTLYNAQKLCPETYQKLGKVSKGTLYRWKKAFDEAGSYSALIPNYNYQANTQKQTKLTAHETKYFLDLLLQPSKISIGNATRLTKYILHKKGFNTASDITYRRFANWFENQYYDTWVLMREGQKALVDKVAPYVERNPAVLEVGDVLVADGHVLDFQVINPFNGKPCRAILVGYQDWKSTAFVGYEIMLTENTQCIASALRNSIINLGKIPKVCYQDNGKAFRSKFFKGSPSLEECGLYGLFGKLGIVPVFAQPYNAKAKVVERFFREFSETFEKLLPSYVGNSVANKPAYMMRNEKFHKEIHNNEFVPTIEQAVQLIDTWMDFHYSQPCPHVKGKTIGEVFEAGRGDGVDIDLLDDLMMAEDLRKVGRNGVKFLGSNYWAEELYGLKEKVIIKYSLFDLSYIKVYGTDGRYIAKAETVLSVHPMASVLGDAKDMYSLNRAIKETRRLQNETKKKARKLLPHIDKNPLPYQKIDEIEEKAEQQKYSEKKDYSGVSVDVSKLPVIKEEKTEEMPLYEWQIEEMRRQQAQ